MPIPTPSAQPAKPASHHHAHRPEWQQAKEDEGVPPDDERRILRKA